VIDRPEWCTDISVMMRRIRIQRSVQRHKDDRLPILPADPRDPDVLRAKELDRSSTKVKPRV
jgi:hypothetical protein